MNIDVLQGLPGSGKSYRLLEEMASVPGLYLFAVPRIDLSAEKKQDLEALASRFRTAPKIWEINSDHPKAQSIAKRIEDLPARFENEKHAIIIVTHEGLMGADLSGFSGWHARIDETPNGLSSGSLRVAASLTGLKASYELRPRGSGWSHVVATANAPSLPSILKDTLAGPLATIHKHANRPQGVFFDAESWDEVANRGGTLTWLSVWTPIALEAFESIKIGASSYEHSLVHRATKTLHPDKIAVKVTTLPARHEIRCRFLIHYFTSAHRGSTSFWKVGDGAKALGAVGGYLSQRQLGYWSGNELVRERFMYLLSQTGGEEVSPKIEGTNTLKDKTSCAYIYSSKRQDGDKPIMDIFGLDAEDIEKAREQEDVFQFVMRGAPRNPDYEGDYHIYLYSKDQADCLASALRAHGVTMIDLCPVEDAGIMDLIRERKPRPVKEVDKATKDNERRKRDKERKARKRHAARSEKIMTGEYRRPGRPQKQAGSGDQPHV